MNINKMKNNNLRNIAIKHTRSAPVHYKKTPRAAVSAGIDYIMGMTSFDTFVRSTAKKPKGKAKSSVIINAGKTIAKKIRK